MEHTKVVNAQQYINRETEAKVLRTLISVALVAYLFLALSTQSLAYSTLKYGSRGSEVKTLQTMLNRVDNAKLTVDGIFGNGTKTAVRNYQKKKGLSVDGICGPKTWSVLSAEYEKLTKPAVSTLKIAAGRFSPGTITQGSSYSFSGNITSNYKITSVRVGVYKDSNGSNSVQQATATPNATSFNISKLDTSIRFGKLSAGSYYFRVVAKDASGTSKTLVNNAFTVKSASGQQTTNTNTNATPKLTGNKRQDAVNLAKSQIGYIEGKNNENKFAPLVGHKQNEPWCATFVTWCHKTAGLSNSCHPNNASTNASIAWYQSKGRWHNKASHTWSYGTALGLSKGTGIVDNAYVGKPGDFVAIDTDNCSSKEPDHTAILVAVDSQYYYTVEGNAGGRGDKDGVIERKYNRSNMRCITSDTTRIVGFGEPLF